MTEDEYTKALLKAENYHREGELAAQEEDYERAEYLLNNSIKLYPNEEIFGAKFSLAYTYFLWGKFGHSINLFNSLEDFDSGHFTLQKYHCLGLCYKSINKYNEAIKCFKKCIELDVNHFDSYDALYGILKENIDSTESFKIKEKLLSLNPNYYLEKKKLDDFKNNENYQPYVMKGIYSGNYKDGKKNGFGTMLFDDGRKYIGEFANDLYNGTGTFSFENGEKYVGEFIDGLYDGNGTVNFASGNKYIGEFKKGKREGFGTNISAEGIKYIGEFKKDIEHGKGKLIFSEDEFYEGYFRYSNYEGLGTYHYKSGAIYEGNFKAGKKSGYGKIKFTNGISYLGNFFDDKYEGFGKYFFNDGRTYEGEFKNGIQNGAGILTLTNDEKYECEYSDGKRTKYTLLNEQLNEKPEFYLFFDTETTGLPKNFNAPITDFNNWPRLIQLAYILFDNKGRKIQEGNYIIKPIDFIIPDESSKINGITNQRAIKEGLPLSFALQNFDNLVKNSDYLVAHNISFDEKIVGAEFLRNNMENSISTKKKICTMEKTTAFCKIDGQYGYKWPKLPELYSKLFNTSFEETHNAEYDIKATSECFWELKKRNLI